MVAGGMPDAARDAPPPAGFFPGLAAAFRRHRPQGSLRWNFSGAFTELEKRFARSPAAAEHPAATGTADAGTADAGTGRRVVHNAVERHVLERLKPWVVTQAHAVASRVVADALVDPVRRFDEGLASTVEAFRFLAARVEAVESDTELRRSPVEGTAWLAPVTQLTTRTEPIVAWLLAHRQDGPVVHAECGDGGLVAALLTAGIPAIGIEPRGSVAWTAAERQVDVRIGPVHAVMEELADTRMGGAVLSGVVDRLPVEELVGLLALVTGRVGPGAPVVVVGTSPEAARNLWGPVAWDLLPGRPLHPETWELLLDRGGYEDVGRLDDGAGADSAVFMVKGRRKA
ncbi:MAG: hypothetical protein ACYDHU_06435 [Acidimicrobiales bacterium]